MNLARQMFVEREAAWLRVVALLDLNVNARKGGNKLVPTMISFSSSCLA